MRFHPTRGVSTISKSKGGYGPDSLCEEEDEVLVEMKRLIDTYHDNSRCSIQQALPTTIVVFCSV